VTETRIGVLGRARSRLGYQLLAAPLLFAGIVIVPAIVFNVYASLTDWQLGSAAEFIGLGNYLTIFTSERWLLTLLRTLVFVVVTISAQLVIGFVIALMLYRHFNNMRWLQTIFLLPMMISEVAAALSWKYLIGTEASLINWLIGLVGIPPQSWLGPTWAFPTVMGVDIWQHTPFVTLVLFAGLQGVSKDVLEAASVDGATAWQQVRHVILPLLAPIILVVLVFRSVFALRTFTTIWLLTGGGPGNATAVLGIEIYKVGFYSFNTGFGAALGVVLLLLSMVAGVVYTRLLGRDSLR